MLFTLKVQTGEGDMAMDGDQGRVNNSLKIFSETMIPRKLFAGMYLGMASLKFIHMVLKF
jgi:hypothetical protein